MAWIRECCIRECCYSRRRNMQQSKCSWEMMVYHTSLLNARALIWFDVIRANYMKGTGQFLFKSNIVWKVMQRCCEINIQLSNEGTRGNEEWRSSTWEIYHHKVLTKPHETTWILPRCQKPNPSSCGAGWSKVAILVVALPVIQSLILSIVNKFVGISELLHIMIPKQIEWSRYRWSF